MFRLILPILFISLFSFSGKSQTLNVFMTTTDETTYAACDGTITLWVEGASAADSFMFLLDVAPAPVVYDTIIVYDTIVTITNLCPGFYTATLDTLWGSCPNYGGGCCNCVGSTSCGGAPGGGATGTVGAAASDLDAELLVNYPQCYEGSGDVSLNITGNAPPFYYSVSGTNSWIGPYASGLPIFVDFIYCGNIYGNSYDVMDASGQVVTATMSGNAFNGVYGIDHCIENPGILPMTDLELCAGESSTINLSAYFFDPASNYSSLNFSSTSQVWVDQNAKWHYDYSNVASGGFYEMDYIQDTLVGGNLCQQIVGTKYLFGMTGPGSAIFMLDSTPLPTQYTYTSSDTVFYWKDNQFFTLFDFGASIGDQWLIGTSPSPFGMCQDSSFVEVEDVGMVTINSVDYQTITLSTVGNSSFGLEGVFVERFGWMDSNIDFQPFPSARNCDSSIIVEFDYVTFKCFEDDSFSLYNPSGEDCEYYLTHAGIDDLTNMQIEIYPNPASGIVRVSSKQMGTLTILDIAGNQIRVIEFHNSEEIDISSLENGIYMFVLEGASGTIIREQVIKID